MDTQLSDLLSLKRFWADIAVGAVSASSIVIHNDIFEYRLPHERAGREMFVVDNLHVQRVEETLDDGIVIAVAFRAHAGPQFMPLDECLIVLWSNTGYHGHCAQ